MGKITVGITTHNEGQNIGRLLNELLKLEPQDVNIILYDDASTDGTDDVVRSHQIAEKSNFHAEFAAVNNGTPSVGRTFIGEKADTEYTALIDGDDMLVVEEFRKLTASMPSGCDLVLTPYSLRGKRIGLEGPERQVTFDGVSVNRVLSGIGGKVYRSALLREFGPDSVKGRSDDVRLNMRIMTAENRMIYFMPNICFYHIEASRKSMKAASLNFEEIQARVRNYYNLRRIYPIGLGYLSSLKEQLTRVIKKDEYISEEKRIEFLERVRDIFLQSQLESVLSETARPAESSPDRPGSGVSVRRPRGIYGELARLEEEIRLLQKKREKLRLAR